MFVTVISPTCLIVTLYCIYYIYILMILVNRFAVNVCIHTDVQFGINLAKGRMFLAAYFNGAFRVIVVRAMVVL